MKRTTKVLMLLLAMALVISASFALALTTSAEETMANTVTVVKADGTAVELNAETKTLAGTTGTLTFDPATGVLILDGVTGIQKVETTAGSLIAEIKGNNTFINTGAGIKDNNANNIIYVNATGGNLILRGDGTLNFECDSYAFTAQVGNVTIEGSVKLVGKMSGGSAIHAARNSGTGTIVMKDSAQLQLEAKGHALYVSSRTATIQIKDNAKIDFVGTGGHGINTVSDPKDDPEGATSTPDSKILIEGNAKINLESPNCALRADNNHPNSQASIIIRGNAVVKTNAPGQTVIVTANVDGGVANLEVSGNASADIINPGKESGTTYCAVEMRGKAANNISFTTTKTVNVSAKVAGWTGAITMSSAKNTILFRDATVNISNTVNGKAGEVVVNGLNVNAGADSSLTIAGKAFVTATATNNSTGKTSDGKTEASCRAHGIWVNPNVAFTVQDNATLVASGGGTAPKSWTGGGIHLHGSSMTVKNNATVYAETFGNGSAAINLQSQKAKVVLTLEDKATVSCLAKDAGHAISAYDDATNGSGVVVNGGTLTAVSNAKDGRGLSELTAGKMEISIAKSAVQKAGANLAGLADSTELLNKAFVFVSTTGATPANPTAPKPTTPDDKPTIPDGADGISLAIIAGAAVASVLTAAVVLRKKIHG